MDLSRIKIDLRRSRRKLLANGVFLFLYVVIQAWLSTPNSGEDSIDPFHVTTFWILLELPILILAALFNWIWVNAIIGQVNFKGYKNLMLIWFSVCLAWVLVIFFNGFTVNMFVLLLMLITHDFIHLFG